MAVHAGLACCVDLPCGGWTERRGFCRAALPQTLPAAREERKPCVPRFSSGASPRSEPDSTSREPHRGGRAAHRRRSDGRGEFFDDPLCRQRPRGRARGGGRRPRRPAPAPAGPGRRREEQVPLRPRRAALVRRRRSRGRPAAARGVATAKAALQPRAVRRRWSSGSGRRTAPPPERRVRPPGRVVLRPGVELDPPAALVLRDEPLSRGRGKAHMLEFAFRRGGEIVWVNSRHPSGISEAAYRRLTEEQRGSGRLDAVRPRSRSCSRRARSAIPTTRRSCLRGWHRVFDEHRAGRPGDAARRVPRLTRRALPRRRPRTFRDRLTAGRHALNVEIEVRAPCPGLAERHHGRDSSRGRALL